MFKKLRKHFYFMIPEVKTCLTALNIVATEVKSSSFDALVKPRIVNLLKDVDKTVCSIQNDGISPRNLIFLLTSNVAGELVSSGWYHVYRGVLSMQGQELLNIFNIAVKELEKSGLHTKEESEKDFEWIKNEIKSMG